MQEYATAFPFSSSLLHTVQVLKEELAGPVHALSLDTKTQEEAPAGL